MQKNLFSLLNVYSNVIKDIFVLFLKHIGGNYLNNYTSIYTYVLIICEHYMNHL